MTPVLAGLYQLRASLDIVIALAEQDAGIASAGQSADKCPFCGEADPEKQTDRVMQDLVTRYRRCETCKKERQIS